MKGIASFAFEQMDWDALPRSVDSFSFHQFTPPPTMSSSTAVVQQDAKRAEEVLKGMLGVVYV